jgi:hypothetical protein
MSKPSHLRRRNFLKLMGAVPAAEMTPAWAQSEAISFLDQSGAAPTALASLGLEGALAAHGVKLERISEPRQTKGLLILATPPGSALAAAFSRPAAGWASPDCLRLVPGEIDGHPALLLSAVNARGFVYGLHAIAEHV